MGGVVVVGVDPLPEERREIRLELTPLIPPLLLTLSLLPGLCVLELWGPIEVILPTVNPTG